MLIYWSPSESSHSFKLQNFIMHKIFHHFMVILQVADSKMKSVDIQGDNLLEAKFPFGTSFSILP